MLICMISNRRMQAIVRKFLGQLECDNGEATGWIELPWPNQVSLMQEALDNSAALVNGVLDQWQEGWKKKRCPRPPPDGLLPPVWLGHEPVTLTRTERRRRAAEEGDRNAKASVGITQVRKVYGQNEVIHGIDIDIEDEEFVVLVGPSGCGKSTLLRMVAGLEEISGGEISIGGTSRQSGPAERADIAMVFQNYALYPHMTVFDNMAFSLKLRKADLALVEKRVARP